MKNVNIANDIAEIDTMEEVIWAIHVCALFREEFANKKVVVEEGADKGGFEEGRCV